MLRRALPGLKRFYNNIRPQREWTAWGSRFHSPRGSPSRATGRNPHSQNHKVTGANTCLHSQTRNAKQPKHPEQETPSKTQSPALNPKPLNPKPNPLNAQICLVGTTIRRHSRRSPPLGFSVFGCCWVGGPQFRAWGLDLIKVQEFEVLVLKGFSSGVLIFEICWGFGWFVSLGGGGRRKTWLLRISVGLKLLELSFRV